MKSWLALIPLCYSAFTFAMSGLECSDIVLRAETLDHKKEVLICHNKNDKLIYRYGGIGVTPEVSFFIDITNSYYYYDLYHQRGKVSIIFSDIDTDIKYTLSYEGDKDTTHSNLLVTDKGRPLMLTEIDSDSLAENTERALNEVGIIERFID